MPSHAAAKLNGRLAAAERHHPEQDHTNLRRALKAQRLEDHVRDTLAKAPPLTEDQKARIAALFGGR
jgi:hypothetical protein